MPSKKFTEYDSKRDFSKTKEPQGGKPAGRKAKRDRFVIHEHHATRLHWDLRLERDGVLVSWAVPNGIPQDPSENRLAVHVEDHPLDYIHFKGTIPEGSYGAGLVKIWDKGTYECEKFRDNEVMVVFHGKKLKGRYVLFPTRGDDWMIHRMDPPLTPRDPWPENVKPMLPTGARAVPDGDGWGFEIAWGGLRTLTCWRPGRLHLLDADGEDVTACFPELRPLGRALGSLEAVMDGEIVVFGEDGLPDAAALEQRATLSKPAAIKRAAESNPATLVIFDVLYLEGRDTTALPYADRRRLLADMKLKGETWQVPANHLGDGGALLTAARDQGLTGIVAKRLDSPYKPSKKTKDWRLVRAGRAR